jgi:hypothetical protein
MSGMNCDAIRAAALDPRGLPRDWLERPAIASHLGDCQDCRDWLEAFGAGEQAWAEEPADSLADGVVARTSGLEALLRDLPSLAEMDPGPDFEERVLLATSRRKASRGWRERAVSAWWAVVRRPRFAWEAAYVATVFLVLAFGNPVGAWQRGTSTVATAAQERLGGRVAELRAGLESWRAAWAPATSTAPGASAEAQASHPIVRAWQAGAAQLQRVTAFVVDAMERTWVSVSRWIGRLLDAMFPPSTEPAADPARSPQ